MKLVSTILIIFLLTMALIIGYVIRRQAGNRYNSNVVEFAACVITGAVILFVLLAISWLTGSK